MTQIGTKYENYFSAHRSFEENLRPGEPSWIRELRELALRQFSKIGLPTTRRGNEKWKYTNISPIANSEFVYHAATRTKKLNVDDIKFSIPWDDDWINMVFLDGCYSSELSAEPKGVDGVTVDNLYDAIVREETDVVRNLSKQIDLKEDGFSSLNTAFLKDGAFVKIEEGRNVEVPVNIVFATSGDSSPTVSFPRVLVVLDPRSKITLIESYVSLSGNRHFTSPVTEINIGEESNVKHYRILAENEEAFHVGSTKVKLGYSSAFSSTTFTKGVCLGRNDLNVLLDGERSNCALKGLYMTDGTQHIDNLINIDHAKPHTTSRLSYKGVLDGKSKAVFGGTVLVRPDAQKADAIQSDKNLLLSDDVEIDTMPALFIHADDVKAAHGATAGHINEDTILYMRSRGLTLKQAYDLLIRGFANEIIDTVEVDKLKSYLEDWLLGSLSGDMNEST